MCGWDFLFSVTISEHLTVNETRVVTVELGKATVYTFKDESFPESSSAVIIRLRLNSTWMKTSPTELEYPMDHSFCVIVSVQNGTRPPAGEIFSSIQNSIHTYLTLKALVFLEFNSIF